MVDSVHVLDPAWQMPINPTTGLPYVDGQILFFDAGTSNARTVFSDSGLSVSLSSTVSCNAQGFPVTSGNAKTLIYTSDQPYKIRFTSAIFGGTLAEFDNVKAALDTASFLTSAAVANVTIVSVSTNRAVTVADKGKLLNVNCSAGAITITLDPAATLTSGFWCGIRHDGTANQVKITGNGSDLFGFGAASAVGFSLTGRGQTVYIACDGTGFKIYSEYPPFIGGTNGVIVTADTVSTPPGSPNPGARYIVGAAPTGAWSGFAQHDIAEANGFGGWFKYTPASDAGLLAYVQSLDVFKAFKGSAWTGPGKLSMQVFTASGTWTKPAGITKVLVIGTGPGGGGGTHVTVNRQGGGGGAGATCIELIDVTAIASETVTVGTGGTGGASGGNAGANGSGATSFGAHFSAGAGGGAAAGSAAGGASGTASGADVNIAGGVGEAIDDTGGTSNSGSGAASFWGGGGGAVGSGAGINGPAFGSGGSGASSKTATAGGNGANGIVVVLEFSL